jgi:hypothetical protein
MEKVELIEIGLKPASATIGAVSERAAPRRTARAERKKRHLNPLQRPVRSLVAARLGIAGVGPMSRMFR